jgi:hypothetical protein
MTIQLGDELDTHMRELVRNLHEVYGVHARFFVDELPAADVIDFTLCIDYLGQGCYRRHLVDRTTIESCPNWRGLVARVLAGVVDDLIRELKLVPSPPDLLLEPPTIKMAPDEVLIHRFECAQREQSKPIVPMARPILSRAWSAALRTKVHASDAARRERDAKLVGWDPYGEP